MANVIGLDLSLSATGIVVMGPAGGVLLDRVLSSKKKGPHRLLELRNLLDTVLQRYGPVVAVVEGYAMAKGGGRGGGNSGRVFDIGEWGGIVRVLLLERGISTYLAPPKTLKMITTLSGNAGKPEMLEAVARRFQFVTKNDNLADAYGLARIARLLHVKTLQTNLVAKEREGLTKVEQIIWGKVRDPVTRVRRRNV